MRHGHKLGHVTQLQSQRTVRRLFDDTDTAAGDLLIDFSEAGRAPLSVSLTGGIGHCPAMSDRGIRALQLIALYYFIIKVLTKPIS